MEGHRTIVTGVDLVDVARFTAMIEQRGEPFLSEVFTEKERENTGTLSLAARFAAKEAVAKALGTGISAEVGWRAIEVVREASGAPSLRLLDGAARRARALGLTSWSISLSHTRDAAVAFVIGAGPGVPTVVEVSA